MSQHRENAPRAGEGPAVYRSALFAGHPSADEQLDFLAKIQRIFQEGEFTATYKFALLIALCELAVERGADDVQPLPLRTAWIAEKFAELYWPQTLAYSAGAQPAASEVLSQNLGKTARVVRVLLDFRRSAGVSTIAAARRAEGWDGTVQEIARTVRNQPLNYLQNVGGECLPFLYRFTPAPGWIELLPGVSFHLRRFNGLVDQLARAHWVRHVRENPRNAGVIGETGDLESFMFGLGRSNLEPARDFLGKLQSRRCFYCSEALGDAGEVDHFVPWSKYPRDLAHNFVLAHSGCNRSKSDMLAGLAHLEHWSQRNLEHRETIAGELATRGFLVDPECTLVVARWAYGQAVATGARAWRAPSQLEPIGPEYLVAFRQHQAPEL